MGWVVRRGEVVEERARTRDKKEPCRWHSGQGVGNYRAMSPSPDETRAR